MASRYEHLNHLGIVTEVCQEIGVAAWLTEQDPGNRQRVSVGTATVALVLNGLGFSNRQLYLVPQFFADKPVEHLLGPGISAAALNDDCLGRTLDWLYAHDVTRLFAGVVLCLLVYKPAELRVRQRLTASGQTVPDQLGKPTARPTLRWLFQCFEGIDLHHTLGPGGIRWSEVLRLGDVHRLVLHLLGPAYENCYLVFQQTAEGGRFWSPQLFRRDRRSFRTARSRMLGTLIQVNAGDLDDGLPRSFLAGAVVKVRVAHRFD